jgi:hypothetical protein
MFAGAGFVAFALSDGLSGYVRAILPGVLLLGAGMTCAVAPLTAAALSSVHEGQIGIASAVNNAISRLAGLISVSLLSLVLAHGFAKTLSIGLDHSGLPVEAREAMIANQSRLHETPIPPGLTANQKAEAESLLNVAFLSGFRSVMFGCAAGAWAGALAVLVLLRDPAVLPKELRR